MPPSFRRRVKAFILTVALQSSVFPRLQLVGAAAAAESQQCACVCVCGSGWWTVAPVENHRPPRTLLKCPIAACERAVLAEGRESGLRAGSEENPGRMLQVLACGAVVFPGLFFAFRRILPCVFKHWSDADVVLVSER